ncbi:TSUP family transporter [Pseudomonas syringae]|nr:TSUP family transporter [Pseudomonas syringae]MBD8573084.1 TSUP family transporter [Pseudomonas syringae]MBD8790405.1 TSUP family transporter [Pseudomonas syringae]MBD8799097.1 TSUP family transporter [Pseudomonas syringae]MBD8809923.1 TSUP family transporter [Pseudomonas syringae]
MPFELSVEPTTLAILAVVAFVAGFIDAIAGGGGLLTTPALMTAGLPPHLVLGTNKLCATFGSATASFTYYRRKLFDPGQWKPALFGTAAGALIGAIVAHYLPAEWINQMLPVVVFACGLYLLFGGTPKAPLLSDAPIKQGRQLPQGLGLGFYDGIAGPGTGAFWTVSTLLLYPVDLVKASGVARSMNFVSNAAALSVFAFSGQVDVVIGVSMGLAVMLGAYFGAGTAIKGGARFIRPVFITMVLLLTVRLAWQHWFGGA